MAASWRGGEDGNVKPNGKLVIPFRSDRERLLWIWDRLTPEDKRKVLRTATLAWADKECATPKTEAERKP